MIYRKSYGNICKPITMTAPDYINMIKEHPRWKDNHALIKTCIDFDKKNVKIEPYVLDYGLVMEIKIHVDLPMKMVK